MSFLNKECRLYMAEILVTNMWSFIVGSLCGLIMGYNLIF